MGPGSGPLARPFISGRSWRDRSMFLPAEKGILWTATVGATCGAIIAWIFSALVLFGFFAAGGYTAEAAFVLPPWSFAVVGGAGAVIGAAVATLSNRCLLPLGRGQRMGCLIGTAIVVVATPLVAAFVGANSPVEHTWYIRTGIFFGLPAGLIGGGICGALFGKKRTRSVTSHNKQ